MKNRFILLLLSLLGLATACDDQNGEREPTPEYGCPYIRFEVKGRVTDPAGNPIRAIEVSTEGTLAHSSATGAYLIESNTFPFAATLRFTDTDGPENGGSFAEQQVEVIFTEADRTEPGDDHWYEGVFTKEVNVQLTPENEP